MQYRHWLDDDGEPYRARFYGLSEVAARMGANTVPAPGTQDYVLLGHSACGDLPALIAAYLKELLRTEGALGDRP